MGTGAKDGSGDFTEQAEEVLGDTQACLTTAALAKQTEVLRVHLIEKGVVFSLIEVLSECNRNLARILSGGVEKTETAGGFQKRMANLLSRKKRGDHHLKKDNNASANIHHHNLDSSTDADGLQVPIIPVVHPSLSEMPSHNHNAFQKKDKGSFFSNFKKTLFGNPEESPAKLAAKKHLEVHSERHNLERKVRHTASCLFGIADPHLREEVLSHYRLAIACCIGIGTFAQTSLAEFKLSREPSDIRGSSRISSLSPTKSRNDPAFDRLPNSPVKSNNYVGAAMSNEEKQKDKYMKILVPTLVSFLQSHNPRPVSAAALYALAPLFRDAFHANKFLNLNVMQELLNWDFIHELRAHKASTQAPVVNSVLYMSQADATGQGGGGNPMEAASMSGAGGLIDRLNTMEAKQGEMAGLSMAQQLALKHKREKQLFTKIEHGSKDFFYGDAQLNYANGVQGIEATSITHSQFINARIGRGESQYVDDDAPNPYDTFYKDTNHDNLAPHGTVVEADLDADKRRNNPNLSFRGATLNEIPELGNFFAHHLLPGINEKNYGKISAFSNFSAIERKILQERRVREDAAICGPLLSFEHSDSILSAENYLDQHIAGVTTGSPSRDNSPSQRSGLLERNKRDPSWISAATGALPNTPRSGGGNDMSKSENENATSYSKIVSSLQQTDFHLAQAICNLAEVSDVGKKLFMVGNSSNLDLLRELADSDKPEIQEQVAYVTGILATGLPLYEDKLSEAGVIYKIFEYLFDTNSTAKVLQRSKWTVALLSRDCKSAHSKMHDSWTQNKDLLIFNDDKKEDDNLEKSTDPIVNVERSKDWNQFVKRTYENPVLNQSKLSKENPSQASSPSSAKNEKSPNSRSSKHVTPNDEGTITAKKNFGGVSDAFEKQFMVTPGPTFKLKTLQGSYGDPHKYAEVRAAQGKDGNTTPRKTNSTSPRKKKVVPANPGTGIGFEGVMPTVPGSKKFTPILKGKK